MRQDADYEAKRALYVEYAHKQMLLDADHKAKLAPLLADYEAKRALLHAEYDAKRLRLLDASKTTAKR